MLITVIGRGHSGTRAMSHTLSASGVWMGEPLNRSGDLIPPENMYEACREFARFVEYRGGMSWDFSRVLAMDPTPRFRALIGDIRAAGIQIALTWQFQDFTDAGADGMKLRVLGEANAAYREEGVCDSEAAFLRD
ncbi:MAG: hypothetical protein IKZ41_01890 [Clostridia bacterium]|nr:hypothetical protein [Clostridia bacterium]